VAIGTAGDDIDQSSGGKQLPQPYPKLIVEVFREIEAECTAPLTAR
jgi:hypothetical protein